MNRPRPFKGICYVLKTIGLKSCQLKQTLTVVFPPDTNANIEEQLLRISDEDFPVFFKDRWTAIMQRV